MAQQTYIITISNTEDLAVLGIMQMDDDTDDYESEFKHGLRSLFNEPQFTQNAAEFAEQTRAFATEIPIGLVLDDAEHA